MSNPRALSWAPQPFCPDPSVFSSIKTLKVCLSLELLRVHPSALPGLLEVGSCLHWQAEPFSADVMMGLMSQSFCRSICFSCPCAQQHLDGCWQNPWVLKSDRSASLGRGFGSCQSVLFPLRWLAESGTAAVLVEVWPVHNCCSACSQQVEASCRAACTCLLLGSAVCRTSTLLHLITEEKATEAVRAKPQSLLPSTAQHFQPLPS